MVFLKLADDNLRNLLNARLSSTFLIAKDPASSIVAMPDEATFMLSELRDPYQIVEESQLSGLLTTDGFNYYQTLQRERPEYLYWNAKLPPQNHIEVTFSVPEFRIEEALEILKDFEGEVVSKSAPQTFVRLDTQSSEEDEAETVIEVKAFLHSDKFSELLKRLAQAQIAAYESGNRVYITKDPDGRMVRNNRP